MDEETRKRIFAEVKKEAIGSEGTIGFLRKLEDVTARVTHLETTEKIGVHPMSELLSRLTCLMEFAFPAAEMYWQRLKLHDIEQAMTFATQAKLLQGTGIDPAKMQQEMNRLVQGPEDRLLQGDVNFDGTGQ